MDMVVSNSKTEIYIKDISKTEFTTGTENLKLRQESTMGSSKAESMKEGESIGGRMGLTMMESIETDNEMVLED